MKEWNTSTVSGLAPLSADGKPLRAHPELEARCTEYLKRLVSNTGGVNAALIVISDGFEVAEVLHSDVSAEKMAAMTSSMLALGEAILGEANLSDCQNVVIESGGGLIIIMLSVGDPKEELLLSVITNGNAMLGQVLWAARQCAEKVRLTVSPLG